MGKLARFIGYLIGILMLVSATVAMIGCSGPVNTITAPTPAAVPYVQPTNPSLPNVPTLPPVVPGPGSGSTPTPPPAPNYHNVILSPPPCGCAYVNVGVGLIVSTNEPGPFSWDFGDSSTGSSDTHAVIHTYVSSGIYRLTVTTSTGYSASADLAVK